MFLLQKIFDAAKRLKKWTLIVVMFCSVMTSLMQVFFRFVLKMPLSFSEELSRYLFIWMSMIGASVALDQGSHFRMDILIQLLSEKMKRYLCIIWDISILIFSVIMVYYGTLLTQNNINQLSPAMRISIAIPYASIPISGVFMVLGIVERRFFRKKVND